MKSAFTLDEDNIFHRAERKARNGKRVVGLLEELILVSDLRELPMLGSNDIASGIVKTGRKQWASYVESELTWYCAACFRTCNLNLTLQMIGQQHFNYIWRDTLTPTETVSNTKYIAFNCVYEQNSRHILGIDNQ